MAPGTPPHCAQDYSICCCCPRATRLKVVESARPAIPAPCSHGVVDELCGKEAELVAEVVLGANCINTKRTLLCIPYPRFRSPRALRKKLFTGSAPGCSKTALSVRRCRNSLFLVSTSAPTLFEVLSADKEEGMPHPDILDACLVLGLDPVLAPPPLRSVGPLDGHDRPHRVLLVTMLEEVLLLLPLWAVMRRLLAFSVVGFSRLLLVGFACWTTCFVLAKPPWTTKTKNRYPACLLPAFLLSLRRHRRCAPPRPRSVGCTPRGPGTASRAHSRRRPPLARSP